MIAGRSGPESKHERSATLPLKAVEARSERRAAERERVTAAFASCGRGATTAAAPRLAAGGNAAPAGRAPRRVTAVAIIGLDLSSDHIKE